MSNSRPENFARTFRDGNKVFILQMGLNAHGSFLMISELLHGRRKGLIIVPEGKLGSGWRGFGFHLRKAIAPDSLGTKLPSQSALFPSMPKFRNHKSFLSAVVDGDRKSTGGSRTGKLALPNIQNSIKSNLAIKSSLSSQKHQNLDLRDKGAGQVSVVPEAEVTLVVQDDARKGVESPLSLEVSLCLVRGLNGKWEVKYSNIKEVGYLDVGPMQEAVRPIAFAVTPTLNPPLGPYAKPKPPKVWQPKRTEQPMRPSSTCETQTSGMSSTCSRPFQPSSRPSILPLRSAMVSDGSVVATALSLISDKIDEARTESSELFDSFLASDVAETELLGSNVAEEARHRLACTSSESIGSFLVSGVAETKRLGSVKPEEARFGSACTTEHGKNLERDPRLFLQEHSGNIVKKWGNSE